MKPLDLCTMEIPRFQPAGSNLCGQTCVAMLLGITLQQAIMLTGKRGRTCAPDVLQALRSVFTCPTRAIRFKGQPLPGTALLKIRYKGKRNTHWVARIAGINFDPSPENFLIQTGAGKLNDDNWLAGTLISYIPLHRTLKTFDAWFDNRFQDGFAVDRVYLREAFEAGQATAVSEARA